MKNLKRVRKERERAGSEGKKKEGSGCVSLFDKRKKQRKGKEKEEEMKNVKLK